MQDKYAQAFAAFGGMTAIGGLIDLYFYRDRKRFEAFMIKWWVIFADVKWSNFGREEAATALKLTDRILGPRLWSWQRWKAVILVTVVVSAAGFLVGSANVVVWAYRNGHSVPEVLTQWWWPERPAITGCAAIIAANAVFLAFSFTLTRVFTAFVGQHAPNGALGLAFFGVLLLLHLGLLLYWTQIISLLMTVGHVMVVTGGDTKYIDDLVKDSFALKPSFSLLGELIFFPADSIRGWIDRGTMAVGWTVLMLFAKVIMGLLTNAVRIVFALVFLLSAVFASALRVWEGLIDSKKPVFTSVLGGMGAIGGAVHALLG